ncbi:MAG: VOC family protein [Pseudomonadota bacterium]
MKHPIVHFEIGCSSAAETQAFLEALFGWTFGGAAAPSVQVGASPQLSAHLSELADEWGHYVTFYVQVEHLETLLSRVRELGGKVLVEPVQVGDQGRFAWITPPEGQIIGLWESVNPQEES